jgi:hypothetical protein
MQSESIEEGWIDAVTRCPETPGKYRVLWKERAMGQEVVAEGVAIRQIQEGWPGRWVDENEVPEDFPEGERRVIAWLPLSSSGQ